jgi:dolichol kinase
MSSAPPLPYSEDARQFVHIGMGSAALLLRFLNWYQAVILAAIAVAFNMWLLRRLTRGRLHRPTELDEPLPGGIVFYPTSVLLLLLLIPSRPDIVAAAWGIMAAGDGAATLVGRRAGGPRIPWNREKSVAGTTAFVIFGGAAGAFLAWWCRPVVIPPPFPWFSIAAPLVAAVAAAAVETLAIRCGRCRS